MEITFWEDNQLDKEHKKSVTEIIDDFVGSEQEANYTAGWPFERAIVVFMGDKYGSFDQLTDGELKALMTEHTAKTSVVKDEK